MNRPNLASRNHCRRSGAWDCAGPEDGAALAARLKTRRHTVTAASFRVFMFRPLLFDAWPQVIPVVRSCQCGEECVKYDSRLIAVTFDLDAGTWNVTPALEIPNKIR